MEMAYTVGALAAESVSAADLPVIELSADHAKVGAVVREAAKQAGLSVVYPDNFEQVEISGDFKGPADAVLDAIARRSDLRFSWDRGVGIIGRPLADDRTAAVVRCSLPDPVPTLQPILSEGGKCTAANGWVFLSDRSPNVSRVVQALRRIEVGHYAVQLLEVYVSDKTSVGFEIDAFPRALGAMTAEGLRTAQINAALSDSGSRFGRSWTGVVHEGKEFVFFSGGEDRRSTSTILPGQGSTAQTSESVVQVGWRLRMHIAGNSIAGEVSNDQGGDQYRIPFAFPRPGLYLLHSSAVNERSRALGFRSGASSSDLRRFVWLQVQPLGDVMGSPAQLRTDPLAN